jgi:hypothetical protein
LDQAVEAGYLHRWHWGHGKGNRRWNYQATLPRDENVIDDNLHPPVIVIENDHKPCPSLTMPKESAAPEPVPPPPEPTRPCPKPQTLSTPIEKSPPPETIPAEWIDEAHALRPDLPREVIEASGQRFIDYNKAKGTRLVDWRYAWRNWIRQERGTKPSTVNPAHQKPEVASAAHRLYTPREESPEEKARERERWAANMRKLGIDPDTGERIARPTPAPVKPTPMVAGRLAELKAALDRG